MTPLRVLLATDAFPPVCGGSGWSTYELARQLRLRGHAVHVIQPKPGTTPGLRTREHDGFEVVEAGSWAPRAPFVRNYVKNERLYPQFGRLLADYARALSIDVVHAQHVLTIPSAVHARALGPWPVVATVRDYWPVCYWADLIVDRDDARLCAACTASTMTRCVRPRAGAPWPLALPMIPYMRANLARKRHALAGVDTIIAVSSVIGGDLRARAPEIAGTPLEIVPNPVDLARVRATAADTVVDVPAGPFAVYAGKLEPNKGIAFLVPALRRARLQVPLVVVGDGSMRDSLAREAADAGLDVRLAGWRTRDDTLAIMARAAFVVFPSFGPESLSRVLLESGALGVPAAAMNTGGTGDIVRHGETGLLSHDAAQLGDHVAQLASDAPLRQRLGDGVRRHVEATFDAGAVAARVELIYRHVIARRAATTGGRP
ncbi:MAG: glycosyltransferase family 4 protein [Acidobacteria bacterium]|nr:glycosyltransferase family 4 protein [Acidobacteriota bacterium]